MKVFKGTLVTPPVPAKFKDHMVLEQKLVAPEKAAVYKEVMVSPWIPAAYEVSPVVKRVVVSPPIPEKREDVIRVELSMKEAQVVTDHLRAASRSIAQPLLVQDFCSGLFRQLGNTRPAY